MVKRLRGLAWRIYQVDGGCEYSYMVIRDRYTARTSRNMSGTK